MRHRYVHGGFRDSEAKFSFYFPPKEQYQGRFFQYITPVPVSENATQGQTGENNTIAFSIESGGYFVESNQGGFAATGGPSAKVDPTIAGFRVSAAAAQYSRTLAQQMYGAHRTYGYAFGGSGGSYRTIAGVQNTPVWDGSVPFIMPSPMAAPYVYCVRQRALRLLGDKFRGVMDAVDPGGSGDMYAGLDAEQRDALREATRLGFPPSGWFNWDTMGLSAFAILNQQMQEQDPAYFKDFWTVPGYQGANPPPSLLRDRVQLRTPVTRVIMSNEAASAGLPPPVRLANPGDADTAWRDYERQLGAKGPIPAAFQVRTPPPADILGANINIVTGAGAGGSLLVGRVIGDIVTIQFSPVSGPMTQVTGGVKAGDELQIDNSNFLAGQSFHRHQVPSRDYYAWDQFRNPDGTPRFPQRQRLLGPQFAIGAGGTLATGTFHGKMIVVETLIDQDAFPWHADWYRAKVKEHLGARTDDFYRLWMVDHAVHGGPPGPAANNRVINYRGHLLQALRDLSAWVERGVPPPQTTNYRVEDAQVIVPPRAADRKGIQPVVSLTANGGARADVKVGQPVELVGVIEAPPRTGRIVTAEWDLEGTGAYGATSDVTPAERVRVTRSHTYTKPGTYFVALRGVSQRQGDQKTPFARLNNLARVRVVVT